MSARRRPPPGRRPKPPSSRAGANAGARGRGPEARPDRRPAQAEPEGRRPTSRSDRGGPGSARHSPPATRGLGGEQVEGRQAVAELLAAGRRPVVDVWMATDLEPASVLDRIVDLATDANVTVRRVSPGRIAAEARTDAPQGVIAHARPLPEADLDALCQGAGNAAPVLGPRRPGKPFLLALDGVTDPHNLGALLRSAEGAGVTGAVLPRHRAVHVTATVAKAAAGAVEHVPIALVAGLPAALRQASALGLWIVGLDEDGDRNLFDLDLGDQGVVVVLGAEGRGLSRLARQRCDMVVNIPLQGRLPSLNVSVAGALALFEVSRRRSGAD